MLLQRVVELITPSNCLACAADGGPICGSCLESLQGGFVGKCVGCNKLTEFGRSCSQCRRTLSVAGVAVATYYDGVAKELIWRLKFQRDRSAARALAKLIVGALDSDLVFEAVTAVPISPARYRERGYNQAELIAKYVARELALPYRSYLGRNNGEHQTGKTRRERFEQVIEAFYPRRAPEPGERILVIDDVVTTGATLDACAKQLKAAGAKVVWGAVAAKH